MFDFCSYIIFRSDYSAELNQNPLEREYFNIAYITVSSKAKVTYTSLCSNLC